MPWNYPLAFALSYRAAAGPRRTQPRSPALRTATVCAQHQSLRPSNVPTSWDYPLAFALSYRAAAGPRRTQPRSPALRTATVCAAPVAAPKPSHYAVGLSPWPSPFLTVLRLVLGGHSRAPQTRGHSRRALRNPCNQIFQVVF